MAEYNERSQLYSVMITVDVLVAEFWMMFLLLGIGKSQEIDRWFKADSSSVDALQQKMEAFRLRTARNPSVSDLFLILSIAFGCTAISHAIADVAAPRIAAHAPELQKFSLDSAFFWLIVVATTQGVGLSFTTARNLEGAGASRLGTDFIFILVATIGMGMDISAIGQHPGLFVKSHVPSGAPATLRHEPASCQFLKTHWQASATLPRLVGYKQASSRLPACQIISTGWEAYPTSSNGSQDRSNANYSL